MIFTKPAFAQVIMVEVLVIRFGEISPLVIGLVIRSGAALTTDSG